MNPDGIPVNPDGIPVNPDGIPTISRWNPTKSRQNPVGFGRDPTGISVGSHRDPGGISVGIPSFYPGRSHRDSHPFFHLGITYVLVGPSFIRTGSFFVPPHQPKRVLIPGKHLVHIFMSMSHHQKRQFYFGKNLFLN